MPSLIRISVFYALSVPVMRAGEYLGDALQEASPVLHGMAWLGRALVARRRVSLSGVMAGAAANRAKEAATLRQAALPVTGSPEQPGASNPFRADSRYPCGLEARITRAAAGWKPATHASCATPQHRQAGHPRNFGAP